MMVPNISAEDLKQAIDKNEPAVILDVRTPEEYSKGKIPNSINLPLDELEKNVTALVPNKQLKIFVYCLSGSRSNDAVRRMQSIGYTNVYSLQNGLLAWRIKKFPLV